MRLNLPSPPDMPLGFTTLKADDLFRSFFWSALRMIYLYLCFFRLSDHRRVRILAGFETWVLHTTNFTLLL